MKRMIVISVALCVVVALSVAIAAAKANFGGTWKLDPSKSEMGGGPGGGGGGGGAGGGGGQMGDVTLTVVQAGDKIDTTRTTARGEQKDSYVADGAAHDFTPPARGNAPAGTGKRTAKWSADGNALDISSDVTSTGQDGTAMTRHSSQHWTISADGKTLTIESTNQGRNGETKSKAVYNKS